jgi:hypothetical protein
MAPGKIYRRGRGRGRGRGGEARIRSQSVWKGGYWILNEGTILHEGKNEWIERNSEHVTGRNLEKKGECEGIQHGGIQKVGWIVNEWTIMDDTGRGILNECKSLVGMRRNWIKAI